MYINFFIIVFIARVVASGEKLYQKWFEDWIEAHRPCIMLVKRKWRNVGNLIVALIVI